MRLLLPNLRRCRSSRNRLGHVGRALLAAGWLTILPAAAQTIPVAGTLVRLVAQEDTDHDEKITVHDRLTPFVIRDVDGAAVRTLTNTYPMSVLLQELKRADDQHATDTRMDNLQLDESALDRTHRFIKDYFWQALSRRIDATHLDQVLRDSKSAA